MKEQITAFICLPVFCCLLLHAVRPIAVFPLILKFKIDYYYTYFSHLESRIEGWLSVPNRGNIKRYGWKKQVPYI
jgi:hypothetical protein